jgi:cupin 2 domain-containing protein
MTLLNNIFDDVPEKIPTELLQTLLTTDNIRIERIISQGQASPENFWYNQSEHEWVLLISGVARLQFEGDEPVDLIPGSFVNIPAHQRHRVDWTEPNEPAIWLAVYYS